MTKTGHHLTGIGAALAAYGLAESQGLPVAHAFIFAFFGATAPDWLEIPKYWVNKRLSVIPHRTLTHWLPLWLILFAISFVNTSLPFELRSTFLGFSLGGLVHLLFDWPNPMGIPVIHPFKRHSLRRWPSGDYEYILVPASWLLGLLVLVFTGSL